MPSAAYAGTKSKLKHWVFQVVGSSSGLLLPGFKSCATLAILTCVKPKRIPSFVNLGQWVCDN